MAYQKEGNITAESDPYFLEDFATCPQASIYSRLIFWIKKQTSQTMILEGVKLLKNPNWAYIAKQAIKQGNKDLLKFILEKEGKNLESNWEAKKLIMTTAIFFQREYDESVLEILDKNGFQIDSFIKNGLSKCDYELEWKKMKNEGKLLEYDSFGFTLAHYAAARGRVDFFTWLEKQENSDIFQKVIEIKSKKGNDTPFHLAIINDQQKIIEWEISNEKKYIWIRELIRNEKNDKGENQLLVAGKLSHINIFERMKSFQSDVTEHLKNKKGYDANKILHLTRKKKALQISDFFSLKCSNWTIWESIWFSAKKTESIEHLSNYSGWESIDLQKIDQKIDILKDSSLVLCASYFGNLTILKQAVEIKKCDIDKTNSFGQNALHFASMNGHYAIVKYLLKRQRSWFLKNKENKTVFDLAYENGHYDIAHLILLEMNSQFIQEKDLSQFKIYQKILKSTHLNIINRLNLSGQTILHLATHQKELPKLFQKILKLAYRSLFIINFDGFTPIHLLAKLGKTDFWRILFAEIGNSNHNIPGPDILIYALLNNQEEIAWLLLKQFPKAISSFNLKKYLFQTAEKNKFYILQTLLLHQHLLGEKLDIMDTQWNTPLTIAIQNQNENIASFLLESGANPNHRNIGWDTPLLLAIKGDSSLMLIEKILTMKGNPNVVNKSNETPIKLGMEKQNQKLIDLLLQFGAKFILDPNQFPVDFFKFNFKSDNFLKKKSLRKFTLFQFPQNLLINSIERNNKKLTTLLIKNNAFINEPLISGKSPLLYALEMQQFDVVNMLLEKNVNLSNENIVYQETQLTKAIQCRKINIVAAMIKKNIAINQANLFGKSPLSIAIEINETPIAKLLLESGATLFNQKNPKNFFLIDAILKKNIEIVKLLISQKADINEENSQGKSALCIALETGENEIAELLIEKGAKIPQGNETIKTNEIICQNIQHGENALMISIKNKNEKIATAILKKGKDIDLKQQNCEREDAFFFSIKYNQINIFNMLKENKSIEFSPNWQNIKGETAIYHAVRNENWLITKWLLERNSDINIPNFNNDYPLLAYSYKNPEEIYNFLRILHPFRKQIDFFVKNAKGENIMFHILKKAEIPNENSIAKSWLSKCFKLLLFKLGFLEFKDQIAIKNSDGESILELAMKKKLWPILKKLHFASNLLCRRPTNIIQRMEISFKDSRSINRKEKKWDILNEMVAFQTISD